MGEPLERAAQEFNAPQKTALQLAQLGYNQQNYNQLMQILGVLQQTGVNDYGSILGNGMNNEWQGFQNGQTAGANYGAATGYNSGYGTGTSTGTPVYTTTPIIDPDNNQPNPDPTNPGSGGG